MIIPIGEIGLGKLLVSQVTHNFLCDPREEDVLAQAMKDALVRAEMCFRENTKKYYWTDSGELLFSPFHSDQYATYLHFLAQTVWRKYDDEMLADKIYCLNKMLNAFDLYYKVELPEVFAPIHPVGAVIGRASFKNYFIFQQNCVVGENDGMTPSIGELVWLCPHAGVIGGSRIGDRVIISAGALVKDEDVPDNQIVFGRSPNLILKGKPDTYFYERSPFRVHATR